MLDHLPPRVKSQPYKVRVSDDTAVMDLVFSAPTQKYLTEILPPGTRRLVSGRIESFKDRLQMPHPDYVVAPEEAASLPQHEAVYGLTEGLTAADHVQGRARGAGARAADAGMAGPGLPAPARLCGLQRGAGGGACPRA